MRQSCLVRHIYTRTILNLPAVDTGKQTGCGSSSSGTADKPAETKAAEGGQEAAAGAEDWKWESADALKEKLDALL